MGYKHLTQDQRCQIYVLKSIGRSQKDIAEYLEIHPSTISREIKRNIGFKGYRYKQAHTKATTRRQEASSKVRKMTPQVISVIESKLTEQWSPEQISGVLRANKCGISHESIYKHVWKNKKDGGTLYKHLRHKGKKYNYKRGSKAGRGCIPGRVDISDRPKIVERKARIGDWEADTIIGAKHKGAILSLVDRKSKFTLLYKLKNKTADETSKGIIACLSSMPNLIAHTITYDNGKEFSYHSLIAKALKVKNYFATPYHSWERGLNEHTNGLVRQYLPKKTDFSKVEASDVEAIQNKLNNRPRKVLGFLTPMEVLFGIKRPQKIALQG